KDDGSYLIDQSLVESLKQMVDAHNELYPLLFPFGEDGYHRDIKIRQSFTKMLNVKGKLLQ
ncbi:hypothetical protein A2U01_0009488, partial [Trifolium medium]|nr:hypothetical protein [Trifolium medium]